MKQSKLLSIASMCVFATAAIVATVVVAEPGKESKIPGVVQLKLPPGWTQEDVQACIMAGTPGEMHGFLAKGIGVWQCKTTIWMGPDTQPMTGESIATVTSAMDGRYTKCEIAGEMPGMGPYNALGIYGFDNVSRRFVSTFIDNHSTGIMNGTGELSADGKTLTWNYNYNCPITKKPAVIREVQTMTGENTQTLEGFAIDPKSGKEYKMMSIEMTRTPDKAS